ncbi:MAG: mannitol dehydrogenase [Oscillospiraceae bacterium]|nr:mannitol dehydrogenase [Oscillospiraceae bacterium]
MQALIYGAGNIGRGFVGQLLYEGGFELSFIDVNKELISLLNEKREYPIKFVDNDFSSEIIIKNIRGIDGSPENSGEVFDAVSKADIMATAVGVNILKFIMKPLAEGIQKRFADQNYAPLNIILCENMIGAGKYMREGILGHIEEKFKGLYREKIGVAEASVGRMVPVQTAEMKGGNPLRIVTEYYKMLYVDKNALRGAIPEIEGIAAHSPFEYFIERKLYIHNMAHAVCAYLGQLAGYEYIWQAIENRYIREVAAGAMRFSGMALERIYGEFDFAYIDEVIKRLANRALGDTAKRVGADIRRKLSPTDRLSGVYKICAENNLPVGYICLVMAAAANFKGEEPSGRELEEILKEAGSYGLIASRPGDLALVKKFDSAIKSGAGVKELYEMI